MSASTVRDGLTPAGSNDVTVLETGTAYALSSFARSPASTKLMSKSARGIPNRQRNIPGQISFSADCQIPDESTVGPRINQTFASDFDRDGTAEPYQFDADCGETFSDGGEIKCKVTGMAMVTPLIYDSDVVSAAVAGTVLAFSPSSLSHTALTSVTAAATGNLFTKTAHGLATGDAVKVTGFSGGSGIVSGTVYYVVRVSADTFQLSATRANAIGSSPTAVSVGTDLTSGTVTSQAGQTLAAYLPRDCTLGTFTGSSLPTGVSISSGGVLSGAPSAAGTFNYTIKCTATRTVKIGVGGTSVTETVTGAIVGSWVIS